MKRLQARRQHAKRLAQLTLLATLAFISDRSLAEGQEDKSVLFEDTYLDSGYTSIGFKSGSMLGQQAGFGAIAFGWRLDERWSFGFKGDVLASAVRTEEPDAVDLDFFLLGGFGEMEIYSRDLYSVLGSFAAGWGQIGARRDAASEPTELGTQAASDETYTTDSMGWVEPEVSGLLHASHRVDLGLSVGYRATSGADFEGYTDGALRGMTAGLFLRGNF